VILVSKNNCIDEFDEILKLSQIVFLSLIILKLIFISSLFNIMILIIIIISIVNKYESKKRWFEKIVLTQMKFSMIRQNKQDLRFKI
jgi:hypothetical protein